MTGIELFGFGVMCTAVGHHIAVFRETRKTNEALKLLALHALTCQFALRKYVGADVVKVIEQAVDDPEIKITEQQIAHLIRKALET